MDSMWEKIKKGLKDGAALSIEKIEEYTKLGKLKIEELAAKRKIERNFIDIGERVYELTEEGKSDVIPDDLAIKKSVENISALREEINDLNQKMKDVSDAAGKNEKGQDDENEADGI